MATTVPATPPSGRVVEDSRRHHLQVARWINLVLGAWLFVSAFLWTHSRESQANTWIIGALIASVAILAMRAPALRYVNALLAGWLFISTFLIDHVTRATIWHNAFVALIVLGASLATHERFPRPNPPARPVEA